MGSLFVRRSKLHIKHKIIGFEPGCCVRSQRQRKRADRVVSRFYGEDILLLIQANLVFIATKTVEDNLTGIAF